MPSSSNAAAPVRAKRPPKKLPREKNERVESILAEIGQASLLVAELEERLDSLLAESPEAAVSPREERTRLQPGEAKRLLRFGVLFEKTADIFGGADKARRWLRAPNRALGGKSPMDLTGTSAGIKEVERLLGRIEYGVYS
ncbi:MAG: MbcA/ParS/Xre antitoxin family protein [Candidatus Sumerlaeota bacterium]|nr:MbcA/ParS/Xre antitoxin family protein [Candidatus Sumerlaeota bacterium]